MALFDEDTGILLIHLFGPFELPTLGKWRKISCRLGDRGRMLNQELQAVIYLSWPSLNRLNGLRVLVDRHVTAGGIGLTGTFFFFPPLEEAPSF
jgi:hypothetical protein